jgi:MoaD family protein
VTVKVKIPTQLRNLTGGEAEVQAAGATLGDVMADLEQKHPGFSERILDGSGSVRRFVNVYVNDEDVRFLEGLSTSVSEGATVSIIPAVAGG